MDARRRNRMGTVRLVVVVSLCFIIGGFMVVD